MDVSGLLKLKASGIQIQDESEYYESVTGRIPLESLRLTWLLFSPGFHVYERRHSDDSLAAAQELRPSQGAQNPRSLDNHYQTIDFGMRGVFQELGIAP
jgi:hypothetical protein